MGGGDYQLLKYKYTTEDGYINTVFRIIKRKDARKTVIGKFRSSKKNKFSLFTDSESDLPETPVDNEI